MTYTVSSGTLNSTIPYHTTDLPQIRCLTATLSLKNLLKWRYLPLHYNCSLHKVMQLQFLCENSPVAVSDIPVTEAETRTEMIDFSKTDT